VTSTDVQEGHIRRCCRKSRVLQNIDKNIDGTDEREVECKPIYADTFSARRSDTQLQAEHEAD
jgi:hypothetical protein